MGVTKRIKDYLDNQGVQYEALAHTSAYTAQEVAAVSHISGNDFAKVVITAVGDMYVMAVLPASKHLDLGALQKVLGSKQHPRLANEKEFETLFPDCELGAEPPLGNLYDVPVVVDEALTKEAQIAFNAGSHRDLIQMAYADFAQLQKPKVGSITAGY